MYVVASGTSINQISLDSTSNNWYINVNTSSQNKDLSFFTGGSLCPLLQDFIKIQGVKINPDFLLDVFKI